MRGRDMYLHLIDKKTAIAQGLKNFFAGKPCSRSGIRANRALSGKCKCGECASAHNARVKAKYKADSLIKIGDRKDRYHRNKDREKELNAESHKRYRGARLEKMKQYGAENKIAISERKHKYQIQNAEVIKKKSASKYSNNKDYYLGKMKEYREMNPLIILSLCAKRRAAKRDRLPGWFGVLDCFVFEECSSLASSRESVTGVKWHVDHCIPLQAKMASGLHCWQNLQVIPASTNISKRNKMIYTEPFEWMHDL